MIEEWGTGGSWRRGVKGHSKNHLFWNMMSMASLTRSSAVKSESSILACRHEEEPRLPQSKFLDGFLESRILLQLLGQALLGQALLAL